MKFFNFRQKKNCLLHCGISNSKGEVYNFDERGCCKEMWDLDCLAIKIEDKSTEDKDNFDQMLENFHKEEVKRSKKHKYTSLDNNCYSYVVRFLNCIKFQGRSDHTKESLIKQFIGEDSFHSFLILIIKSYFL